MKVNSNAGSKVLSRLNYQITLSPRLDLPMTTPDMLYLDTVFLLLSDAGMRAYDIENATSLR